MPILLAEVGHWFYVLQLYFVNGFQYLTLGQEIFCYCVAYFDGFRVSLLSKISQKIFRETKISQMNWTHDRAMGGESVINYIFW